MGNCGGKLSDKQREEAKEERYKPVNEGNCQSKQKPNKPGPTAAESHTESAISQKKLEQDGTISKDYKQEQENNNSTNTEKQINTTAPPASLEDGKKAKNSKQNGIQQKHSEKKISGNVKKSDDATNAILSGRKDSVNRGHVLNPANVGYEFSKGVKMSGGKNEISSNNSSTNLPVSSENVKLETEVDGGSFQVSSSEITAHPDEICQSKGDNLSVETNPQPNSEMDEEAVMQQSPGAFADAGSTDESLMYMNTADSHKWEGTPEKSSVFQRSIDVKGLKGVEIITNNLIIGKNAKIVSNRKEHIKKEEYHHLNEGPGKGKDKIIGRNIIIGPGGEISEEADITVDNRQHFLHGNPTGTDISQSCGGNPDTALDQTVNTKPMDIKVVKAIAKAADSVGMIQSPRNTGTVFRVGYDKVMTAWHIIEGIIYIHTSTTGGRKDELNVNQLYQDDVNITFNFESATQNKVRHYHIERLCYHNADLDIAVLKLKEKNNLPPALTNFVEFKSEIHEGDSFYLIGHHHGEKKQMDFVLKYWEPFGNRLKELNEWSKNTFYMYGYTGMLGYEGVDDKRKIIFNCNFRHGASGAPGIFVLPNGEPAVITILLRGFPSFYYFKNFTDAERSRVPQDKLKQQGVNMGAVRSDLLSVDPVLAKEIYNGIENSCEDKAETKGENELLKQCPYIVPLKREISMPESTDTAELLLTAAKETTRLDELENKKIKLQRQNATESEEETTRTNTPCPKPLGGTKPYGEPAK